jgi:hypothetical protein
LQWLSDNVLEKVWWPDNAFLWILPARRRIRRLLESGGFDGIISVGLPFSAHVAVLGLPARFGLPWLADMGDPFTPIRETRHNNRWLYGAINRRAEKAVLTQCTAFALTNPAAVALYQDAFSDQSGKLVCIGPIAQPTLYEKRHVGTPLRLGYFGTFYRDVRSPEVLLQWFETLTRHTNVELHIAGEVFATYAPVFALYQKRLGDRLVYHGHLAHQAARQLMADCDVLVSLGNVTTHQLPSKCADYYASGLPVMHLSVKKPDPVDTYFQDHPCYVSITPNHKNSLEPSLDFMATSAGKGLGKEQIDQFLEHHNPGSIARQYLQALFYS